MIDVLRVSVRLLRLVTGAADDVYDDYYGNGPLPGLFTATFQDRY